jgi:hypothetical protein
LFIFPCDYAYTYQFVFSKKVKSFLKMKTKKIKKNLTPCGTMVGTCRRAVWRPDPGAAPPRPAARSAILPPCPTALGAWWQKPAAVGYDARCIFLEIFYSGIYFLKIKAK